MLPRVLCAVLASAGASSARQWHKPRTDTTSTTLVVDTSQTYQTIDGFGFCEAFQRASALYHASAEVQRTVLDLLFDTKTGAGFSILRIGLGSSPNATKDHMNSIEADTPSPPFPSTPPHYAWDGNASGQVWMAQRARQDYGVDTFYADAWSAPGFMKTNGRDDQGGQLCGVAGAEPCASGSWIAAYVDYLVEYVKLWTVDAGIPLRYVGFVNEPNLVKPYATMLSDGAQAAQVIRPLRAALSATGSAANLSSAVSGVGISCCEAQGWSMQRDLMPALQGSVDDGSLALITTHAYKGQPSTPDRPLNTSLKVWITENSPIMQRMGFSQIWFANGSETEGLTWANNLQTALALGNVSAYLYWIGVGPWSQEVPLVWLSSLTNAPVLSRRESPNQEQPAPAYRLAATYWATAHWSRFIRPGAARVGMASGTMGGGGNGTNTDNADTNNSTLRYSAYRNKDGSIIVQTINNSDRNASVTLLTPEAGTRQSVNIARWVTDNSHSLERVGSDQPDAKGKLAAVVTPRSLTTFEIRYRWKDT